MRTVTGENRSSVPTAQRVLARQRYGGKAVQMYALLKGFCRSIKSYSTQSNPYKGLLIISRVILIVRRLTRRNRILGMLLDLTTF